MPNRIGTPEPAICRHAASLRVREQGRPGTVRVTQIGGATERPVTIMPNVRLMTGGMETLLPVDGADGCSRIRPVMSVGAQRSGARGDERRGEATRSEQPEFSSHRGRVYACRSTSWHWSFC
jgi:hypothetical protein